MDHRDLKRFINIPTLRTERLCLRRLWRTDLEDVFAYSSDPEVPKYLLWSPHRNLTDTKHYLAEVDRKYKRGEFYDWGIEYGGHIIGTVGFSRLSVRDSTGELGYVIHSKHWRQGIATEAVKRVIKYGFETLGLNRIEARFLPENTGSRRVAESCGLTVEGTLREAICIKGRYADISIAAITADEYFSAL